MGIIVTGTLGLSLWIILWATEGMSGLDAILAAAAAVLVATAVHNVLINLPRRKR
jgi:hypothetical protein